MVAGTTMPAAHDCRKLSGMSSGLLLELGMIGDEAKFVIWRSRRPGLAPFCAMLSGAMRMAHPQKHWHLVELADLNSPLCPGRSVLRWLASSIFGGKNCTI